MPQILLYLPVVHAGHEAFFARHADAAEVLVLGAGFRDSFKSLAKDIQVSDVDTETGDTVKRPATPADKFPSPFPNEYAARALTRSGGDPHHMRRER